MSCPGRNDTILLSSAASRQLPCPWRQSRRAPGKRSRCAMSSNGLVQASQREAGFQQRKVERRAVVSDDHLEALQQITDGEQHRRFFIEVAHEVLDQ